MRSLGPQRADQAATPWILASESPRRIDLLRSAGQRFENEPSRVDESPRFGESASELAARVALDKARAVAARNPQRWVLAADTIVVVDRAPFGKPRDRAEAEAMLTRLSGRTHEVVTAFVLVEPGGGTFIERSILSEVVFRTLAAEEIVEYVAGGEPLDKAGAYAIQGGAAGFVTEVRGSVSNVIGLPMAEVEAALRTAGLWISLDGSALPT